MHEQIDPRSITVLVVDDEPRLVDVVRMNLEVEGYRVLEAFDDLFEPSAVESLLEAYEGDYPAG